MAAQEDGRPASWLRAVHLCPARVLVFPSPFRPRVRERHPFGLQAVDRRRATAQFAGRDAQPPAYCKLWLNKRLPL